MTQPSKAPRSVFLLNGALVVGLVVLVAAVALVVKPPSPPGVAEFAPQAAKAIQKAPDAQAGNFGSGSAACQADAGSDACASAVASAKASASAAASASSAAAAPSATPSVDPTIGAPPGLQCFQWPDGSVTQTFDPQSGPCVSNWPEQAKGNGGATATGVTGTAITVAVDTEGATGAPYAALQQFLNDHYEFYGRQIQFVYPDTSADNVFTPTGQQAAAATYVAANPFAAADLTDAEIADPSTFLTYMAQHKVVTLAHQPGQLRTSALTADAPYVYSYAPTIDVIEQNLGQMICNSLPATGNATYAGGTTATKPRKFGILVPDSSTNFDNDSPETKDLTDALGACNQSATVYTYDQPTANGNAVNTAETQLLLQMSQAGVTSIVYLGTAANGGILMKNADNDGFEPEWIESGVGDLGTTNRDSGFAVNGNADQLAHMLGVTAENKYLTLAASPWAEAYGSGGYTPTGDDFNYSLQYREMVMLAAGIEAAGPDLTPQTLAKALASLAFPNPGAGAAPSYQASVGFEGSYTFTHDLTAWSWNQTAQTRASTSTAYTGGATCDVDKGARFSLGKWPTTALPFFAANTPCY